MRFLVDENLPSGVAYGLRILGHDADAVLESGARGSSDEIIWNRAGSEMRVLITQDLDFPLDARPAPPGVILLRFPDAFDVEVVTEAVTSFVKRYEERIEGRIAVLAPGREPRFRDI